MRKGHLRLVSANNQAYKLSLKEKLKNFYDNLFISRTEKLYILKDVLINIYRDYEITTGICDVPYFVKAENKIKQIIREDKINYYFNRLKKFKKDLI